MPVESDSALSLEEASNTKPSSDSESRVRLIMAPGKE
jgi:hypothetical protein